MRKTFVHTVYQERTLDPSFFLTVRRKCFRDVKKETTKELKKECRIYTRCKARIFKPFKETRNRFPAWRAGMTTLFVVPAPQDT
jgi:hypothetical protein